MKMHSRVIAQRETAASPPRSPRPASNRQHLQMACRDAHGAAERKWVRPGGFDSLQTYRAWLSALCLAHARIGLSAAARVLSPEAQRQEARRHVLLCADLGTSHPQERPIPVVTKDWAWGACYALNGSAIGAAVLIKQHALRTDWPQSYLQDMRRYATSGGLARFLDQLNAERLDLEQAAQGAGAVFDMIADAETA